MTTHRKLGAGIESVKWFGCLGNEGCPGPADSGDDSVRPACPPWVRGRPSSPQDAAGRCRLIKISRPQNTCWCGHSPATQPRPRPVCCPVLSSPFLANHTLLSSPETGASFLSLFGCCNSSLRLPLLREGQPPAEISDVLPGSMGTMMIQPDYFWSMSLAQGRVQAMKDLALLVRVKCGGAVLVEDRRLCGR